MGVKSMALLCALAISGASAAEQARYQVKIQAQPLGAALQELASQSGIQIIFFSKLTEGRDAPALNGKFTPEAALDLLLRGTDLTFRQLNDKTIEVRPGATVHSTSNTTDETAASRAHASLLASRDPTPPPTYRAPVRLAQAESGSPARPAAEVSTAQGERGTVQEIIVTARKVRENQQDTPVAITAFSGDALEKRQVFQTDNLTQLVPNLQFGTNAPLAGNNASSQVFIRGIGQTDPTSTVDPGVGLYIDDVYIGSAVGSRMDLRDI